MIYLLTTILFCFHYYPKHLCHLLTIQSFCFIWWLYIPLLCIFMGLQLDGVGVLVVGQVTPSWALMPRLQEPVWDMVCCLRPVKLRPDSVEKSDGLHHFELVSISMPGSEQPSGRLRSSFQVELHPMADRFSASVWSWSGKKRMNFRRSFSFAKLFYRNFSSTKDNRTST